jgi:hypothetical protein
MVDNIRRESYWDYMGRRLREEKAKEEQLMTVQLEEDDEGNLVLPLPTELLNQMGWDIGDDLLWEETQHGTYTLRKKD